MKFIVCLGNPGKEYQNTPHNIGYEVAHTLARDIKFLKKKNLYLIARLWENSIYLVKPITFMNLSGQAVVSLLSTYSDTKLSEILVVCDDFSLPLGKIRYRLRGSDGGHRGLKSIISAVGEGFPRIRIGVGPVPEGIDPSEFVLTPFGGESLKKKNLVVKRASEIIEKFISKVEKKEGSIDTSATWVVE